ncbi:MAG: AAA family ATPase [Candidatus Desulfofervidaceae bacterium]|nr:AAA family ATPase [Candidatus Desulfofervidaceae bacterium]
MYKSFYGLKENPFKLSPDINYFFIPSRVKSILRLLHYGLEQNVGFMMITGEVGVGKTSLVRYFLANLSSQVERAYLLNPAFTKVEDLLQFFLLDLKVITEVEPTATKVSLLQKMHNYLLSQYEQGRKVLFIIDDAQAAPDFILEELRLLSNFETNTDKLVQMLLVGQPELKEKVESPSLRQLSQRIAIKVQMEALNREETDNYLQYRLLKAGGQSNFFNKKAVKLIHKKSKGLPRLINLIAERALIAGYLYSKPEIGKKEVKMAVKELGL